MAKNSKREPLRSEVQQIKAIQRRALNRALSAGRPQDAEDFAQYMFEHRDRKQTTKQAWIDYLRVEYGDTRTLAGATKSRALRYWEELTAHNPVDTRQMISDFEFVDAWFKDINLSPIEKVIGYLRWAYQFSAHEIAFLFGVSIDDVSIVLSGLKRKFRP